MRQFGTVRRFACKISSVYTIRSIILQRGCPFDLKNVRSMDSNDIIFSREKGLSFYPHRNKTTAIKRHFHVPAIAHSVPHLAALSQLISLSSPIPPSLRGRIGRGKSFFGIRFISLVRTRRILARAARTDVSQDKGRE